MAKKKYIIIIVNCVIGLLLSLSIALNAFQLLAIVPTYQGPYRIEKYQYGIEVGSYEQEKKYDIVVDNYWDAYFIGKKEISERYPNRFFGHSRYNFKGQLEYRCDVFYDSNSHTWLVHAHKESLNNSYYVMGGAYGCIISSDGTVIACWGEP